MYLVSKEENSNFSHAELQNNRRLKPIESNPSDSGWGTGSDDDDHDPYQIGKQKTESLLGKADAIIEQIGESWESEFSAQVGPIKSEFKNLSHRVQNLMLTEANISQTLSNLVETSYSNERDLINEITDDFGETLEQAVKINDNINELQRRIKVLNGRMKKRKEEFINDLASQSCCILSFGSVFRIILTVTRPFLSAKLCGKNLEAKNVEGMDDFKEQLSIEAASVPAKIQAAKSTKAEQKYGPVFFCNERTFQVLMKGLEMFNRTFRQVQLKLAKVLADGLPSLTEPSHQNL